MFYKLSNNNQSKIRTSFMITTFNSGKRVWRESTTSCINMWVKEWSQYSLKPCAPVHRTRQPEHEVRYLAYCGLNPHSCNSTATYARVLRDFSTVFELTLYYVLSLPTYLESLPMLFLDPLSFTCYLAPDFVSMVLPFPVPVLNGS